MGIASMVLGIISLIFSFIPGMNLIAIIMSIIGIALGALGKKNESQKGMATAGLVCSIIALALSLIVWIACASIIGTAASAAHGLY